jgi:hypothetical protein
MTLRHSGKGVQSKNEFAMTQHFDTPSFLAGWQFLDTLLLILHRYTGFGL